MNRRDFFKRCLGAAASMLLPAAKVVDAPKVVMDHLIATLRWESLGGMRVNFMIDGCVRLYGHHDTGP